MPEETFDKDHFDKIRECFQTPWKYVKIFYLNKLNKEKEILVFASPEGLLTVVVDEYDPDLFLGIDLGVLNTALKNTFDDLG